MQIDAAAAAQAAPTAEEQQQSHPLQSAAANAAQPPVALLYRHALESIFAFTSLADLHALMSVCKEWQSAVLSMAPMDCRSSAGASRICTALPLAAAQASRTTKPLPLWHE